MAASGFGDSAKAREAIREHRAGWRQMTFRPGGNGLQGESSHRGKPYADRAIIFGQGNGRHEGNLVLRTTSDLAARALAAEVGQEKQFVVGAERTSEGRGICRRPVPLLS